MESDFIAWLREQLPPHPALRLGPGDDAAILAMAGADAVLTTDMLMDGVDFRIGEVDPRRIGRKALAVNLSDLAAMACEPVAVLISLALPREGGLALGKSLYEGMLPLAAEYGVAIAGGDTNSWDGPLAISVTAIGKTANRPLWTRSGARSGDVLLVTGPLGGSILGKQFDFTPRIREALRIIERYEIHAAMDISDGLAIDLSRLAAASGCGAALDLSAIPIAPAAHELVARELVDNAAVGEALVDKANVAASALEHALGDGEDFELLLATDAATAERMIADRDLRITLAPIGVCVKQPGLWQRDADRKLIPLAVRGYEHRLS